MTFSFLRNLLIHLYQFSSFKSMLISLFRALIHSFCALHQCSQTHDKLCLLLNIAIAQTHNGALTLSTVSSLISQVPPCSLFFSLIYQCQTFILLYAQVLAQCSMLKCSTISRLTGCLKKWIDGKNEKKIINNKVFSKIM